MWVAVYFHMAVSAAFLSVGASYYHKLTDVNPWESQQVEAEDEIWDKIRRLVDNV